MKCPCKPTFFIVDLKYKNKITYWTDVLCVCHLLSEKLLIFLNVELGNIRLLISSCISFMQTECVSFQ